MRYVARNIQISLDAMLSDRSSLLTKEVARSLGANPSDIKDIDILRKSVDARKKANVHFVVNLAFTSTLPLDQLQKSAKRGVEVGEYKAPAKLEIPKVDSASAVHRPVIVGFGPAGLFCALYLARAGLKPIVLERGQDVDERTKKVASFASGGSLDPESNIQFGEGGAGTFSDGKLTTGTKNPLHSFILQEFVDAGAPCDILIDAKPHIGTDYLSTCVKNMRKQIIELGGCVKFDSRVKDILLSNGCVEGVVVEDVRSGAEETVRTDVVVLAIGHSARDTFGMLHGHGLEMERKPFACGVRIEHLQSDIDSSQYGKSSGHPALPPADYKLAVRTDDDRGVYTFCMCPGGEVVAASSEEGGVCVNGMSNHARDGVNANSALLVEVAPDDLAGDDVLEGIAFQRDLERAAYRAGGESYKAPVQTVGDFLANGTKHVDNSGGQRVSPSYPRGCVDADLHDVLPRFMTDALRNALPKLGRKLNGFDSPNAIMCAVEARSSSPVRIVRDKQTLQSVSVKGLYPCGEGAGYAGGIMSAATDGLRVAQAIVSSIS